MVLIGEHGGGRLTPEDVESIIILRHCYGISRSEASALPVWELDALIANGRALLGADQPDASTGLTSSDVHVLTTPGVG